MLSANPKVWNSDKSQLRMNQAGESGIHSVQIAGADPELVANAARFNEANGAQLIDINMGCPAKKVNKKLAGSALLQHPELVEQILRQCVAAVEVPVTLKIRTGWDHQNRNGVEIAKIAEDCGIQALAVHGRTRIDLYKGEAEYDTIRAIKEAVSIPVIANGDIDSPEKAKAVQTYTGADGLMIGRPAQGRPWLFREINHYLATGEHLDPIQQSEVYAILVEHVSNLHAYYGEFMGPRIARKHVGWYLKDMADNASSENPDTYSSFRQRFNGLETGPQQLEAIAEFFNQIG